MGLQQNRNIQLLFLHEGRSRREDPHWTGIVAAPKTGKWFNTFLTISEATPANTDCWEDRGSFQENNYSSTLTLPLFQNLTFPFPPVGPITNTTTNNKKESVLEVWIVKCICCLVNRRTAKETGVSCRHTQYYSSIITIVIILLFETGKIYRWCNCIRHIQI